MNHSRRFALLAAVAGTATFIWALAGGRLLLYGDATAHLAIARRMVDSATPGLSQWGTVWLPLPHLLMALTVWYTRWWRDGVAGALPALAGLVLATWFLHRIVQRHWGTAAAGWAAAFFCLNPSLLYLSAVPMTESVYLAAFLGWVDACDRYTRGPDRRRAWQAGGWGLAASLCRYDGWFALPFGALALAVAARPPGSRPGERWAGLWRYSLAAGAGPVFWFAYNAFYLSDPLEFARGPYSARQIYLNALRHGGVRYPGDHAWAMAALYFLKTAALTCGAPLAVLAIVGWLAWRGWRRHWPALLLLLPLPWYLWAMWSGNVPIFVPEYWPHGFYNLRYGVQMLPAVALFSGMVAAAVMRGIRRLALPAALRHAALGAGLGLALVCGWGYLRQLWTPPGPVAYAEAVHNAPARLAMEHALAGALAARRPGEQVLMYYGTYPGALADDGIPVRAVVQEANFHLWQRVLATPQSVAWVVVEADGPVAALVNRRDLRQYFHEVARLEVASQPTIEVYRRNEP